MAGKVVLLTQDSMRRRAGSVLYTRDVALELLRRRFQPIVYCPDPGDVSAELEHATVPVLRSLDQLDVRPDVIHGNHTCETAAAVLRFPDVPAIFVCHSWDAWQATPPEMTGVSLWVGVDETSCDRLSLFDGVDVTRIRMAFNGVDLRRFTPRAPLPERPKRVLVFSNYATEDGYLSTLREACARTGLELDVIGAGVGRQADAPETILGDYDLVFAKARCALEAAAVGCAVVLSEHTGMAGMLTTANVEDLRRVNFGRRCLQAPITADSIAAEIALYDAADAASVQAHVRATMAVEDTVGSLLDLYDEAAKINEELRRDLESDQRWLGSWLTRLAGLHLEMEGYASAALADVRSEAGHISILERRLAEQDGLYAEAEARSVGLTERTAQLEAASLEAEARSAAERDALRAQLAALEGDLGAAERELTAFRSIRTVKIRDHLLRAPVVGAALRVLVRRRPA